MHSSYYPPDWREFLLGDLCNIQIGGTPARNETRFWTTNNDGHNWVAISDLASKWITNTQEQITDLGVERSNVKLVPKGTLLLSFKLTIGRVGFAGIDLYTNEAIAALLPKTKNVWIPWLYHALPLFLIDSIAEQAVKGQTLNKKNLQVFSILCPPDKEQRSIATILDTLDTQIQHTEQLITKLKHQREGMLHDLLTRGLDENGELRDPKAHPELFKDSVLGRIPKEWKISDLSSLCHRVTDGCHQSVNTSTNGIPFLFVSCIRNGQILWDQSARISLDTYNEISKGREPSEGLVLYTVVGSYGHAALVKDTRPFSFQRHIAYILPDITKLIPSFLVIWLNSASIRSWADKIALGNAQKTITLRDLSRFPIPLLRLEEQKNISNFFEALDSNIDFESSNLAKLKHYKQGLMHDLLTGRVRVGIGSGENVPGGDE